MSTFFCRIADKWAREKQRKQERGVASDTPDGASSLEVKKKKRAARRKTQKKNAKATTGGAAGEAGETETKQTKPVPPIEEVGEKKIKKDDAAAGPAMQCKNAWGLTTRREQLHSDPAGKVEVERETDDFAGLFHGP